MGKSATVWSFLRHRLPDLAGSAQPEIIIWWSFSELHGEIGPLLTRLAELSLPGGAGGVLERAVSLLRERRCLLVLDGLERQLHAYSSMAYRPTLESEQAPGADLSEARRGIVDPRLARLLIDVRAGAATKVIVTSRLMPADLEAAPGRPQHGVRLMDLPSFTEVEGRSLLVRFGVPPDRLLETEIHRATGFHPLLLQIVARGLLASRLDPADMVAAVASRGVPDGVMSRVAQARSQLMDYVLSQLSPQERLVAQVVATAVLPLTTAQIRDIVARVSRVAAPLSGRTVPTVEQTLGSLTDLALVAQEEAEFGSSSWSMHAVVRGAVRATHRTSDSIVTAVTSEFLATPRSTLVDVRTAADLHEPIQLFHALCDLDRHDDAAALYIQVLHTPLTFQVRDHQERLTLLGRLFPRGWSQGTPIRDHTIRALIFNATAMTYQWLGQNKHAASLLRQALASDGGRHSAIMWSNLASILLYTDDIEDACHAAVTAIRHSPGPAEQVTPLTYLAMILRQTGRPIDRLLAILNGLPPTQVTPAWGHLRAGDLALWAQRPDLALVHGRASLQAVRAQTRPFEAPVIEALRLVGQALVDTGDPTIAQGPLREALHRAQDFVLLQEELPARVALAKAILDHSPDEAETLIREGFATRDPREYRWYTVDALVLLHQLHRRLGNTEQATGYHRRALELATTPSGWAYAHGLRQLGLDRGTRRPHEMRELPGEVQELLDDLEVHPHAEHQG
jgi:tetratricopeptide (TPR) repeat protein